MNKETDQNNMTAKPTAVTVVKPTESDKMWTEIMNLPIAMFSLPAQCIKQHVQRFKVSPDAVYLKLNSSAVITALEEALANSRNGNKYATELAEGGYVIVRRAPAPIVFSKE